MRPETLHRKDIHVRKRGGERGQEPQPPSNRRYPRSPEDKQQRQAESQGGRAGAPQKVD